MSSAKPKIDDGQAEDEIDCLLAYQEREALRYAKLEREKQRRFAITLILCALAFINGFSFLGFLAFTSAISIIFFPLELRKKDNEPDSEAVSTEASSSESKCYRPQELERAVAILKAGKSLLICGPQGCGKTALFNFMVEQMRDFRHVVVASGALKLMLKSVADQIGLETQDLEGKNLKLGELQVALIDELSENLAFIFCDEVEAVPIAFRRFLEELDAVKVPMLLVATSPQPKDIFLKLQRIELKPMNDRAIRAIAAEYATLEGMTLTPANYSQIIARSGGLPILARRGVDEEHSGLKPTYDHQQFIDGTPYLIAFILIFAVFRIIGREVHNDALYLLGGLTTIVVTILRMILFSLPQKSRRLGQ